METIISKSASSYRVSASIMALVHCQQTGLHRQYKNAEANGLALSIASANRYTARRISTFDFYRSNNRVKPISAVGAAVNSTRKIISGSTIVAKHIQPKSFATVSICQLKRFGGSNAVRKEFKPSSSAPIRTANLIQVCCEGHRELEFYRRIQKSLRLDISIVKNAYLLDNSSSFVRQKQKELIQINKVIRFYKTITVRQKNSAFFRVTDSEPQYAQVCYPKLALEREYRDDEMGWTEPHFDPSALIRSSYHNFLMRGRIVRFILRRPVRDKRRLFRTLVRVIFKQMDDQSGHDEFPVIDRSVTKRNLSSTNNWFIHELKRNYRAA